MRRPLAVLSFSLLCASFALADDTVRDVQTQLKSEGFYFGEVDGQGGASTTAAIKRYQIRNGLEVTGEINAQTLQALGIGGTPAPAPAGPSEPPATPSQVAPPPTTQAPATQPPVNLRRNETPTESDRRVPRQEEVQQRPTQPPEEGAGPGPANQPSERYRAVFAGTPYAIAPRVVQEETFLRAQRAFAERGLLPAADGSPGPATEEATLVFQRSNHLPTTGRLDLETLAVLHLLPGRGGGNPPMISSPGGGPGGPGPNRVARPMPYKGIWVQ